MQNQGLTPHQEQIYAYLLRFTEIGQIFIIKVNFSVEYLLRKVGPANILSE